MIALEEGVPLARLTTIGTGGPARYLAPARRRSTSSRRCSPGRPSASLAVETIGLGSNVLAHDDGVDALLLRLVRRARRGARRGRDARRGRRGDQRGLPASRARTPASAGFEFASAIPGTAGGGVRMNAGAYGSDWRAVLIDATVVAAGGAPHARRRRARAGVPPLGSRARGGRGPGAVPAHAEARRGDQGRGRRAARAAQGDAADDQADLRQRVREPRRGAGARAA